MRKIYEACDGAKTITLYRSPVSRMLIRREKGYVADINDGKGGAARYPAFPRVFVTPSEMSNYLHREAKYGALLSDLLIQNVRESLMSGEPSRLYPGHDVALLVEDSRFLGAYVNELSQALSHLENERAALTRELHEAAAANARLNDALEAKQIEIVTGFGELEVVTRRLDELALAKETLERAMPYARQLLELPEDMLAAILASKDAIMPPKSSRRPEEKYRPSADGHFRPAGYETHAAEICRIPFVHEVRPIKAAKGSNHKDPVHIHDNNLMVTYHSNHPQLSVVITTAKNKTQLAIAANYIKQRLFRRRKGDS